MIIHFDCNNFFASCEIATNLELRGKPVVVVSSMEANSGIILALTAEAKALGLKRGNPIFQVKSIIEINKVAVFACDHNKYREISNRIMKLVIEQDIIQDFVQYSVDEFFGSVPTDDEKIVHQCVQGVKDLIAEQTNIPVSCGCSQTYTLAKVATWYAKHFKGYNGICILNESNREKALFRLPIGEVWGIGWRSERYLAAQGVTTAYAFCQKTEAYAKNKMGVVGVRTWRELHGICAVELVEHSQHKTIQHTRTFTYMIDDIRILKELLAGYVEALSFKLREQHSVCSTISVLLCTNRHRLDLPQYSICESQKLSQPTHDTQEFIATAFDLLDSIYRPRYKFKKMGVIFSDIVSEKSVQLDLFDIRDIRRSESLMKTLDSINQKFGMKTIGSAIAFTKKDSLSKDFQED